jgi:hypothetical protein
MFDSARAALLASSAPVPVEFGKPLNKAVELRLFVDNFN